VHHNVGFALILLFGRDLLINTFDLGSIEQYIWFLLIGFFGMGLYTTLNYWAVRQRDYKRITYTKINQGAGGSVCKILLGILAFGPVGLIIGHIVSQIAGITTLARAMWKKERKNLKAISWSRMKSVAKTYKSFPVFNFPASIVNTMSLQLPPLMLLALYDSEVVGFYALANMLVVLPGSLISGSMGQAYLGEASKMVRERSQGLRVSVCENAQALICHWCSFDRYPGTVCPLCGSVYFWRGLG
jgi:O-antigen/teichoic acid export membrane protein